MKVIIPGGTGQVGTLLARAFHQAGHEVVVLSRAPRSVPEDSQRQRAWRVVPWDAGSLGAWTVEIDRADLVINLAGRSVNCRYTPENRRLIKESRVNATRVIGAAIARSPHPPRLWLQAGTATIYAHRYEAANDEATGLLGGSEPGLPDTWRFSIDVATAWERALAEADTPRTRKVCLRSAMVMSPDRDGIFDTLLRLVRFGLGGSAGDGRQYVSWIHGDDFTRAILWLVDHEPIDGAVNLASPGPLPYAEFMRTLCAAWGMPWGLPSTEWMLEIGAWAIGTETELVLKSRRVIPGRLLDSGFAFQFPAWAGAARDLCDRWRRAHDARPAGPKA